MTEDIALFLKYYKLPNAVFQQVPGHEGGRNTVYIILQKGVPCFAGRISRQQDRSVTDYEAETEFQHYLAANGAPVADVIPTTDGHLIARSEDSVLCLFTYAPGMLIADNGYRYREGAPLSEYFYHTGKALGSIHRLSKLYRPKHHRPDYFEKYNMDYINQLIPDAFSDLKNAIACRLADFRRLPRTPENYGTVHFDFSDGNYHVNMQTGDITVFDFENAMECWYMFDLANLWTHGEGWVRGECDPEKRAAGMQSYFQTVLQGYRSQTDVSGEMLRLLPLFIDMVLIENIVDEFECCARAREPVDEADIAHAADCLIRHIPYAGLLGEAITMGNTEVPNIL